MLFMRVTLIEGKYQLTLGNSAVDMRTLYSYAMYEPYNKA
jgi:hypothetical protein